MLTQTATMLAAVPGLLAVIGTLWGFALLMGATAVVTALRQR